MARAAATVLWLAISVLWVGATAWHTLDRFLVQRAACSAGGLLQGELARLRMERIGCIVDIEPDGRFAVSAPRLPDPGALTLIVLPPTLLLGLVGLAFSGRARPAGRTADPAAPSTPASSPWHDHRHA